MTQDVFSKILGGKEITVNNTTANQAMSLGKLPQQEFQQRLQYRPEFNIPKDQENKVIATVMAEALGEDKNGLQAVLNVVSNRIGTPDLIGGTRKNAFDVVSEHRQFSAFSVNNKIYTRIRDYLGGADIKLTDQEKKKLELVKELYQYVATNDLNDVTNGATHYYNPDKVTPYWADKLQDTVRIGNHIFGKLP